LIGKRALASAGALSSRRACGGAAAGSRTARARRPRRSVLVALLAHMTAEHATGTRCSAECAALARFGGRSRRRGPDCTASLVARRELRGRRRTVVALAEASSSTNARDLSRAIPGTGDHARLLVRGRTATLPDLAAWLAAARPTGPEPGYLVMGGCGRTRLAIGYATLSSGWSTLPRRSLPSADFCAAESSSAGATLIDEPELPPSRNLGI
jgi:hypothetical protein